MGLFGRKNKANAYVLEEHSIAPSIAPGDVAITGSRARLVARSRRRIAMCSVVFAAAFASLGIRLALVSFHEDAVASKSHYASSNTTLRPDIVDRHGKLLATNLPMIALEIAGAETWDAKETVTALSSVLTNIDADAIEEKLRNGRYVEVAASLTPSQQEAVFNLGLPGLRFQPREKRYYPQRDLAAHIVGHTEPGKGGVMGIEVLANERAADELVETSIDIRAQQMLEFVLADAIDRHLAKAGWAILMDVETSEVIALASLPDFDPNKPGVAEKDWRRNRATYDRYELGSAFKALTTAAALEAGTATESSTYEAIGNLKIADKTIGDFHGENRVLTLSEVVQHSSNIGMAKVVFDLGIARQKAFLKSLGLFDALPIELRENRPPQLPAQWGPVESATISYGHGIAITPLHLVSAFCAVVNGGAYRAPTFMKVKKPSAGEKVFSQETSIVMRRILRRVITNGTASGAEAEGYYPIGKTATAEKPVRGGYDKNSRIASFLGAFPGYAPRYALLVSLDEPKSTPETKGFATAGWNAAPTFSQMVERLGPILGVMPMSESEALAAFFADKPIVAASARSNSQSSADHGTGGSP